MRVVAVVFLIARILAGLWVAAVAVFAGLQTLGYIPQTPKLEPIAWVISLVIIGLESVGSIIRERVDTGRARLRADLDRWCLTFVLEHLRDGHQARGLTFEELGLSVWVPTMLSRFRGRFMKLPREEYRFRRLNRFRPDGYPQSSAIQWSGSIGTLGQCWREQKEEYWDCHAIAAKYDGVEMTDKEYARIAAKTRQGFSRAQFTRIVSKYSEIKATPIMHTDPERDMMIGVLTIDRVYTADQTPFIRHLDSSATQQRAVAAAAGVASTLSGKNRGS